MLLQGAWRAVSVGGLPVAAAHYLLQSRLQWSGLQEVEEGERRPPRRLRLARASRRSEQCVQPPPLLALLPPPYPGVCPLRGRSCHRPLLLRILLGRLLLASQGKHHHAPLLLPLSLRQRQTLTPQARLRRRCGCRRRPQHSPLLGTPRGARRQRPSSSCAACCSMLLLSLRRSMSQQIAAVRRRPSHPPVRLSQPLSESHPRQSSTRSARGCRYCHTCNVYRQDVLEG